MAKQHRLRRASKIIMVLVFMAMVAMAGYGFVMAVRYLAFG